MIKAILFDFFDVIRSDQYKAWLKRHGFSRHHPILKNAQEELDDGTLSPEKFFQTLGTLSGEKLTYEKLNEGATVNRAVLTIIKALRKNYRIVIISNTSTEIFRDILKKHSLEKNFDEIIISAEVGVIKPHPEIFEIALERLCIKASEAIFIDDNKEYLKGAENVGIKGIHFTSATQLKQELRNAGVILE